jgi:mono/diheme cytochrome c family protein
VPVYAAVPGNVAAVIGLVLVAGWLVYIVANMRRSRPELGSEIEVAPNRKPYYTDEELEGPKLERVQLLGLGMLIVCAVGLPLVWLAEPGRQAGALAEGEERFAEWGAQLFATTADGGFNCAGCHGGMSAGGGVAPYTLTDDNTGEVRAVSWVAPALNTVLYRFSEEEVRYILVYGRPFSPMSPWGVEGGGPMNEQQIDNLIAYMASIQIPMEGCDTGERICAGGQAPASLTDQIQAEAEAAVADGRYATLGEALFNLDLAGGAYSCARCHTRGWSYGDPQVSGGGALGPNLTGGSTIRQFPSEEDHVTFIERGSEDGKRYGQQGQGSGKMPGFGSTLTTEQIRAIVDYERDL